MDCLAGKTYFVQKKHLKMPKIMDNFSDRLTLEGAGGQTNYTRLTFRHPPENFGVERLKLAIEKVSGIKIAGTRAR